MKCRTDYLAERKRFASEASLILPCTRRTVWGLQSSTCVATGEIQWTNDAALQNAIDGVGSLARMTSTAAHYNSRP